MATVINEFTGEYEFLSNYFPCTVSYNGYIFTSSEAAYQAQKCVHREDIEAIAQMKTADEAKQYAKTMDKRTDWDMIKEKIMYKVVKQKFIQNSSLGQKLLDTENAYLIEGNNWGDQFWGICPVVGDVGIDGLNMLGTILMVIRNELKPLPKTPIAQGE